MLDIRQPIARTRALVESGLRRHLPQGQQHCAARLNHAVYAAVFPGGKRLRPVLSLLAAQAAGCVAEDALPAACAVEFLHGSSLIFDDLPAMDDASLRRGRPALHLAFGEDMALLAALALLNRAYAIFAVSPRLMAEAVASIGENGMIGGQSIDLASRAEARDWDAQAASRNQKTTALMRLTLVSGALAAGAGERDVEALARCGEVLGEAYQVCDDLHDAFSPWQVTGKTALQDARHQRPSPVPACGEQACREHVTHLTATARSILRGQFGRSAAVETLNAAFDRLVQLPERAGTMAVMA